MTSTTTSNLHSRKKQYHHPQQHTQQQQQQQHQNQNPIHYHHHHGGDEEDPIITALSSSNASLLLHEIDIVRSSRNRTSSIHNNNNNNNNNSTTSIISELGTSTNTTPPKEDAGTPTKDKDHPRYYNHRRSVQRISIRWMTQCILLSKSNGGSNNPKKRSMEYSIAVAVGIWFVTLGIILGYILLHHQHRKVILHIIHDPWHHGKAFVMRINSHNRMRFPHGGKFHHHYYTGSPKFVTVVLPSVVNTKERLRRLEAIHATWGPYARSIFVVHSVLQEFPHGPHLTIDTTSLIMPSDPYSYPQTLLLPNTISVADGLQRLYYTIRTIYEKVNPDFAYFVNDHTYVIPEHLCVYLDGVNADEQFVYDGHALKSGPDDIMFNSGAAGYVLSRATMKRLIDKWDAKDPTCWLLDDNNNNNNNNNKDSSSASAAAAATIVSKHKNKDWIQGNPGLITVQCLNTMNITAIDTRDRQLHHRFHAFPILRLIDGTAGVDEWYNKKHQNLPEQYQTLFDESYSVLLSGSDCCSDETISFHYVEAKECRALYSIRKTIITNPNITNEVLHELFIQQWPKSVSDIGHYSRGLPIQNDTHRWYDLYNTIRKISKPELEMEC